MRNYVKSEKIMTKRSTLPPKLLTLENKDDRGFQQHSHKNYETAQCGNFRIFLTLRFYVKSNVGVQTLPFSTFLEALKIDFEEILPFFEKYALN